MQRLILLRHGKAESVSSNGGDFDRGLTARGRRDTALMGRVIADAGLAPDLALVSAARRTQETWDEAEPSFPGARVQTQRGLYLATNEHLAQAVEAERDSAATLMIVGHNPGLHEFALSHLGRGRAAAAARDRLIESFPTAAAAVFVVEPDGSISFETLLQPRDHGGGSL